MRKGLSALFLTLWGVVSLYAQAPEDLQRLLDKAFMVTIEVKVVGENSRTVMSFRISKVAISGESIPLRLNGNAIKGNLIFTPYEEKDKQVLLVAQVQLWVQEAPFKEGKYVTSHNSIPVSVNEPIQFFPLGAGDGGDYNIQLDITVVYYKDYLEMIQATPTPADPPPGGRDAPP